MLNLSRGHGNMASFRKVQYLLAQVGMLNLSRGHGNKQKYCLVEQSAQQELECLI